MTGKFMGLFLFIVTVFMADLVANFAARTWAARHPESMASRGLLFVKG